jgi:phage gp45-like
VNELASLAAKIRNLFTWGKITRRDSDDLANIQGTTRFGRTVEGKELFPYGFAARAKEGAVLFLFEGGDMRNPVMLPVCSDDGVPDLQEGDAALWTKNGGWIVVRDQGEVELFGKDNGGIIKVDELKNQLSKITQFISTFKNLLDVPVNEAGNGAPSVFQTALKAGLVATQSADFSQIASDKVFHGSGSS